MNGWDGPMDGLQDEADRMGETSTCGLLPSVYSHSDYRYNQIKEELSYSYLYPICAYLGASLERKHRLMDSSGIDAIIELPDDGERETLRLDVQLEGTSTAVMKDGFLLFRIDRRLFERMARPAMVPFLLFVLTLPEDVQNWVQVDDEGIIEHGSMYWCRVEDVRSGAGRGDVLLKIPLSNRVSKDSLRDLLLEQSEGMR